MAIESWRYLDPAIVAERLENGHKLAREYEEPVKRKRSYGNLTAATLRLVNRLRIKEIMARVRR